ncbi:hypothetical protein D030_2167A, partial [Vibrio parahaemolyticus AQ3810]
MLLTLYTV